MLINQKLLPEDIDSLNQTIAKGMTTPGLLAYTAAAKYADILPLYRQEKIFGRYGIDLCFLFERLFYAATKTDYQALLPQAVDPVQLA